MTHSDQIDRYIKLRAQMMRLSPFFSTLLYHSPLHLSDQIPTMGVDSHGAILLNPTYSSSLSDPDFCGVICHEVLHLALQHISRASSLSPKPDNYLYYTNIAADIIVNQIILSSNLNVNLPDNAITEKTYATLTNQDPSVPYYDGGTLNLSQQPLHYVYRRVLHDLSSSTNPSLAPNFCIPHPDSHTPTTATTSEWDSILETAKMAESFKSPSSSLLSQLDAYISASSRTDYRAILNRYIYLSAERWEGAYDRRFIWQGDYIDMPQSSTLDLKILIDVSGSIDEPTLMKFMDELHSNLKVSRWATVNTEVWFFNTELIPEKLTSLTEIGSIPSGGGTDFGCFKDIPPTPTSIALIYTDGWSWNLYDADHYSNSLNTDNILWCLSEDANPEIERLADEWQHTVLYITPCE